jgi:general secretion pathway protein J
MKSEVFRYCESKLDGRSWATSGVSKIGNPYTKLRRRRAGQKSKIENRKSKISPGFTLFEILIAIFILAVMVTTVFSSFHSVFSSTEAIENNTFHNEMVVGCFNRMIGDLTSVYVTHREEYTPSDLDDSKDPHRIVGDSTSVGGKSFGRLRFTSLAHLQFENDHHDGIAEIVYYVDETEDETYALKRSDNLHPYPPFTPQKSDPVLFSNVQSLSFTYYDAEGETFDYWDSDDESFDTTTPLAVGIQLEFGEGSGVGVFETTVFLPVYRKKAEAE